MNTKFKVSLIVLVSLLVGFFAGMEYEAYKVRTAIQGAVSQFATAMNNIPTTPATAQPAQAATPPSSTFIKKAVGDDVELATIKFKVNSVSEKQTINGILGPVTAKEGAKFVVIDVSITNITNEPFTFYSEGIAVVDDKERQFAAYGDTIGHVQNYMESRKLSPGITERGIMVYELPIDSISYSIATGKGGTNDIYSVVLK